MSDSVAIASDSLCKTYRDGLIFRKKFDALKNVSFQVNRGEAFGLLGPNGAGKTTFIKILLGIISITRGKASMLGFPAGSLKGRERVGYLPEHLRVPAHMTGYTALECFGNLANIPTPLIRERRDELLTLVGLGERGKDRVKKYSKGMVQRLGLAQALLNEPQLLVLDEPTDGLDPGARAEVREIIRGLTEKGVTIFLNSHLLGEVESTCDRVAILNRGELKYCGSVEDIGEFIGAPQGEFKVRLEVRGDRTAVDAGLQGVHHRLNERGSSSEFMVEATVKDQDAVDAVVDALRHAGVSLVALQREHVSLEDAFLKIVDDPTAKSNLKKYLR